VLNLINPDALIARTNLARGAAGRPMDAYYIARLSADALPTIQEMLPILPRHARAEVAQAVGERWHYELARRGRWTIALADARRHPPVCTHDCPSRPAR
jgi:hypothetical protein